MACACTGACKVPPYRCGEYPTGPYWYPSPYWYPQEITPTYPSPSTQPYVNTTPYDMWGLQQSLSRIADALEKIEKKLNEPDHKA